MATEIRELTITPAYFDIIHNDLIAAEPVMILFSHFGFFPTKEFPTRNIDETELLDGLISTAILDASRAIARQEYQAALKAGQSSSTKVCDRMDLLYALAQEEERTRESTNPKRVDLFRSAATNLVKRGKEAAALKHIKGIRFTPEIFEEWTTDWEHKSRTIF